MILDKQMTDYGTNPGGTSEGAQEAVQMTTQSTTKETTQSNAQMEAIEEQQLLRRARWMLKNFSKFIEQKHKQEEEIRTVPLFTRDDALYVLSGMGAHKETERVQTSNIANTPMKATMNVDATLERMNREVVTEVSKGYDQLCKRVNLLSVMMFTLDVEHRTVAKQLYLEGKERDFIIGPNGGYYSRKTVKAMKEFIEQRMVEVLTAERQIPVNEKEEHDEE